MQKLMIAPSILSADFSRLGEEINQVVAYFNYANRTVLGLGVDVEGDILGLSPSNSSDENNWNHQ